MDKIVIEMENGGKIHLTLDRENAPITVENFVSLAKSGFYDGLIFHRVIEGFMIQGGCPDGTGMGGPKHSIKGEFSMNGVNNPIKHMRGVISMARSNDMDSAGSQFFIMHNDAPHLDGLYAAFGKADGEESLKVIDEIATSETGRNDRPINEIRIKSITVE
ncbi:MAG: peptidylprolyl isomerase [Clostridia bacterium]